MPLNIGSDLERNFYETQLSATDGSVSDLQNRWLQVKVGHVGTTPDLWNEYLRGLGYSGALNDMKSLWSDSASGWGYGMWVPPTEFLFPFQTYPLRITWNDTFQTTFDARSYAAAALAGTTYYVDYATGNDGNNGLTTGTKKKSIGSAVNAGNLTLAPYNIQVTAGIYPKNFGLTNAGANIPSQPCAVIPVGGRVLTGSFDFLTWTVSSGAAYQATRSNVTRVLDLLNVDSFGNYAELVKVADAATCASTANSWAQVGSTVYAHRADGGVVADANLVALTTADCLKLTSVSKDYYMENVDIIGGGNGGLFASGSVGNIVAADCTFKFAGGSANLFDGVRILNVNGLAAFVRCKADANAKDGFNYHHDSGGVAITFGLTIDCQGHDNGRYTSQSNNGWTAHDDCYCIDVNGVYEDNYGGTVHIVNASQLWALGTAARRSKGDTSLGGGIPPTEYRTEHTSRIWLDRCIAAPPTAGALALNALDTSFILTRAITITQGTQNVAVGATITTY